MKKISAIVSVVVIISSVLTMSGCLKYTSNILDVTSINPAATTQPVAVTTNPYQYGYPVTTTNPVTEITTAQSNFATTVPAIEITTAIVPTQPPVTVPTTKKPTVENTTAAPKDPSAWTKDEIVKFISTAVNKTKSYTGSITAGHKESMTATVTECPGGAPVKSIINKIVSGALSDSDETLSFSGGRAKTSEGETIAMLLPKSGAFSLPVSGVASASASKNGNTVTVRIQLVPEKGSLSAPPAVHSTSMGYLDPGSLDLSAVTITSFDTTYPGSQMEFTVDTATGYVKTAVYTISLVISASGKVAFASGNVGVEAKEVESWNINW